MSAGLEFLPGPSAEWYKELAVKDEEGPAVHVTAPLTMASAETRLVVVHGYGRQAARDLLRKIRDVGSFDGRGFSLDYSLTGARFGRGHFTFLEDA